MGSIEIQNDQKYIWNYYIAWAFNSGMITILWKKCISKTIFKIFFYSYNYKLSNITFLNYNFLH